MIEIRRYTPTDKPAWNDIVSRSKNGTFLHLRGYMDYHADRFTDFSLLALNSHGKLVAVLPANIAGDTLYSHQGLTYGGWITPVKHFTAVTMLEIWDAMMPFLKSNGINSLIYKAIPYIYHRYPADEDIYALFRHGAQIAECNIAATAVIGSPLNRYSNSTKLNIDKTHASGFRIAEESDYSAFWQILTTHLQDRYGSSPVHSLEEITLLHSRFPKEIRLFNVYLADRLVAGMVFYIINGVAHAQYTGNTPEGMHSNAIAFLHDYLMHDAFAGMRYYDFGTCNEQHGEYLNEGLLLQKNGLGGRGVAYQIYKVDIK